MCSNFIMFWPKGKCLIDSSTSLPNLLIIFPNFFYNISNMTWITPSLNCNYPLVHVHRSHRSYGYSPFTLCSWQITQKNSWCSLWHLCWHHVRCWLSYGTKTTTCISFNHIQFLLLMNQHCVHQKWHSHFSWHCHYQPNISKFTSPILHNSRIHYLQCGSSQRK